MFQCLPRSQSSFLRPSLNRAAPLSGSTPPPPGFPASSELDAAVAAVRLDAAVPSSQVEPAPPQLSAADAAPTRSGWDAVDHLDVAVVLKRPPNMAMLEQIPQQFRESWAEALALVHSRANDALRSGVAGLELDRTLVWAGLLPQLLLRAPRRLGRKGLLTISARFRMFQERDMASLVSHWEADVLYFRRRLLTQTAPTWQSIMRKCKRLIARREISKATRILNRHGLGDLTDLAILAQMQAKHPPRQHAIPEAMLDVKGDTSVLSVDLQPALSKLRPFVAPGPSGMRNEYLMILAGGRCPAGSEAAVESLNTFCTFWACNQMPDWFNRVFASGVLVAPMKEVPAEAGAVPDCRPLVIQEPLRCVTERTVMAAHADVYRAHLAPQQLAVGVPDGDGILVHGIRLLMEKLGPDAVVVHLDVQNAYNALRRLALLQRHQQVPDLADLMPTLVAALGSEAPLVVDGRVDLVTSAEGIQQGSPLSTPDFCVAIHPEVKAADAELSAKGGAVRFYADDGYLVGLPADVWPVFHRLRAALLDALDLHVHDDYKTTAYSADMERAQVGAPPGVRWPQLDGHYGLEVLVLTLPSRRPQRGFMVFLLHQPRLPHGGLHHGYRLLISLRGVRARQHPARSRAWWCSPAAGPSPVLPPHCGQGALPPSHPPPPPRRGPAQLLAHQACCFLGQRQCFLPTPRRHRRQGGRGRTWVFLLTAL